MARKSPVAKRRRRDRFATRARAEKRSIIAKKRLANFYKNRPNALARDMETPARTVFINGKRWKSWLHRPDLFDLTGPGANRHLFDLPRRKGSRTRKTRRSRSPTATRRNRSPTRKSPKRKRTQKKRRQSPLAKRAAQAQRRLRQYYKNRPSSLKRDLHESAHTADIANNKQYAKWLKDPSRSDLTGKGSLQYAFDFPNPSGKLSKSQRAQLNSRIALYKRKGKRSPKKSITLSGTRSVTQRRRRRSSPRAQRRAR
jgi:hypothetical protein